MVPQPPDRPSPQGIVRLLNTAAGRVLCLAGDVDGPAVSSFLERYGREPVRIDGIDAGSVTALSAPALDLVRDHLDAAERAGRQVVLRPDFPEKVLKLQLRVPMGSCDPLRRREDETQPRCVRTRHP